MKIPPKLVNKIRRIEFTPFEPISQNVVWAYPIVKGYEYRYFIAGDWKTVNKDLFESKEAIDLNLRELVERAEETIQDTVQASNEAANVNAVLDGNYLTITDRSGSEHTLNLKEIGFNPPASGIPKSILAPSVQSSLNLADTALQIERDPTVPAWAKNTTKPTYNYSEIEDTPSLSAVATSGSYNDLTNKPTIPSVDSALSESSTNPVQNKAITAAILENEEITAVALNDLESRKADKIDSSHKLNADLVEDGTTNKSYTATEKTKLAGIAAGAEVNVQANWNESNTSSDAFIQNKPTDLAHIGDTQGSATIANFDPLTDTVHIAAQVLSASAQAQVRENIGAEKVVDRAADAQTGKLGYKVLRGDASFASQVSDANTIYEIRDVFDLNSGSVTIPAGCTLKFVGGKMLNGTIVGNNTSIEWSGSSIFNTSVLLSGTFNVVLNPRMFGVLANDASVPECLYATHSNAIRIGVPVKYDGIKSLDISVVSNTPVITLSEHTDFCGCVFNIQNNVKDFYLFSLINSNSETAITVSGSDIDSGDFSNVSGFPNEPVLLVVNDETAWLPNRSGESGSVYRKDILLCEKKRSHNSPIFPYNTEDSSPICTFSPVTLSQKYIGNCIINRTGSKITHFVLAQRIYNLLIENISANTDVEANASIDILIKAQDCAHVKFKDISINGTYSISTAGYAFVLDNVFDFVGERIVAEGNWGVFDANNLNVASLYNSTLNRFDVHYYGRDFLVSGCTDVYVTESSFFGYCKFENCRLENNVVFVSDQGYCAMPFNIIIENCSTKANSFYICKPTFVDTQQHRSDISDYANSLPSIYVNGLENKNGGAMYLYYEVSSSMEPFVAINSPIIDLRGIRSKIRYSITPTLYGKTQPSRPYMVDVTASTTFRFVVPQEAQTNIKNIIAGLVIKDCHFDAEKYASAFTELETFDIKVNFRDCIINDLRYAGVGKNLFSFDGCYLNLSQNEGGNSYALKAVYRNCTVNTAKQMRINSYNVGVRFENCVNALGDTVIVYGLPSMQNIDLEFATDSFARLLKVNTYADVASLPSYNTNIRATAYVSAINKYVLWNGTAWVNMDGTALT